MSEQIKKEQMKQKIDLLSEALAQIFTEDAEDTMPNVKLKKKGNPDFLLEEADESELPLVSVIMPVYNAEKYLKKSIHSILNQKYRNLELICINDGSTDNSLSVLKSIAKSDDRMIIIDQENAGPARARNAGLDAAKGKYISFVDADDCIDIWMYYCLVERAIQEDADIIVFGGTPFPDGHNAPGWIWTKLSPRNVIYDDDNAGRDALFREESSKPFIWLHFLRRDIIEAAPKLRMNEEMDLGEDQLFQFMYFPRAEKVVFWDKRFYYYRWFNEGSLMWTYNNKKVTKFNKHLGIVENVFASWKKAGYADPYGDLISWMVGFIYYDLISFPKYMQHKFAVQVMEIAEKYDQHIYMCNEYEMEHGKEIEKIAKEEVPFNEAIKDLQDEIERTEKEIQDLLNSKAFRLGKYMTTKKERLNVETVLPPTIKRN
ncbi:MAG: glycosyltransferase [Oscillospiraceae bacterium]|nr:glycosyltransferase [Oscillospiraceae bacterium]